MKFLATVIFILASFGSSRLYASLSDRSFVVTQSMHYKGGVDISSFGVLRNPIIYESSLLPLKDTDQAIQGFSFEVFAAKLEKGPLPTVIDIERWSIYTKDESKRADSLKNLLDILKNLRTARPDLHFGYYGVVPSRVYWPLVDVKQKKEKYEWEKFNQRAFNDFVPHVDAIFPSLYTFYEDQNAWEMYAKQTLMAARKFNKPVYCYLWPMYHENNIKLKGQYVSPSYWRLELETCRKYSDGIVIWNYEPDRYWDPEAPWWKETLNFLKTLKEGQISK